MRLEDGKVLNLNSKRIEDLVDGPAVAVNKAYFIAVDGGTALRLVFMEQVLPTSQPSFRCAVVLSAKDAMEFSELLKDFVDKCKSSVLPLSSSSNGDLAKGS